MHANSLINLIGVALSVFFILRLNFQASENRPAATAFSGFLVSTAFFLLDDVALREAWYLRHPEMLGLSDPIVLCIGPLFYLYARTVTEPAFVWRFRHLAFFSLPILLAPLSALTLLLSPEEQLAQARQVFSDFQTGQQPTSNKVLLLIFNLYHLGFLGAAWWRLWKHRDRVAEEQDEGRSHPVHGIGLFATLVLLIALISAVFDYLPSHSGGGMIVTLSVAITLFVLLWLISQPQPFLAAELPATSLKSTDSSTAVATPPAIQTGQSQDPAPALAEPVADSSPSPAPSPTEAPEPARVTESLKPEELALLTKRIRKAFEQDRMYLEPDLSLLKLAELTKTTRHKLSAALREGFGATFHQLVSRYRTIEAARILKTREGRTRTIADIAFASGFNTLSAFNAAFRAQFGVTPSAYRDSEEKQAPKP